MSSVRRGLAACFVSVGVLVSNASFAADKAACAAAAEDGQKLKNASKLVDARKQFLVCSRADCPPAVTQDCVKWLGEAERGIGTITVKTTDPEGKPLDDARVFVDGATAIDRTAPTDADPGHHVVRCERPGFVSSETGVDIAPGERRQLDVRLALAPPEIPADKPLPKKASWSVPAMSFVLGGVGVVGVAGFAVFGAMGLSDQDQLRKTCAPFCTSSQTSPVNTKFAVADISLAVGIAALSAAVIVAILWPSRTNTAWRSQPTLVW